MNYRNTFYWGKRAMAVAPRDPASAHRYHWLHSAGPLNQTSGVLENEQRPLEGRVWYRYPGQTNSSVEGTSRRRTVVARVLDDGSTQAWKWDYNDQGHVTKRTDPLGRQTTYIYAPNGIDLLEVRQTTGGMNDLLVTYGNYTLQHRPEIATDAAGQTTTFSYNTYGQIVTRKNPKNETTSYAYDMNGYLQSITGPATGATRSFTRDGFGRVRTVTNVDSYAVTTDYDAFDRPTHVAFPDATYEDIIYDKLDAVQRRDRLGRVTRLFYDALRRIVATRDALGRTTTRLWCVCGSLEALIDAKGQKTSWDRDLMGRVIREIRPDGAIAKTYTYESFTSRLKTVIDAKGQIETATYNLDDTLQSAVHTNVAIATPPRSYSYDLNYPRVTSMVDGTGTTTYTYKPVGMLGALRNATIDGPLADDTITYDYDEIGRISARLINGVGTTQTYDALGRVATSTDPSGTFSYNYDGATNRVTAVTYPNGQLSEYAYYGVTGDRLLQTIHHKYPGGATLSKFDYTYDKAGNMLTWRQQTDSAQPVEWRYTRDEAGQLLTAVKWTTNGTPAVLKRYSYGYDPAGNRTVEQIDDAATQFTVDSRNRLSSRQPGGVLRVAGRVNEPATVTIQGKPANVTPDNQFEGSVSVASSGTSPFTIIATDPSGNARTQSYTVDVTGTGGAFTYDLNGNLTTDGVRTFEWDARNQLVAINMGLHRTEFTYDGLKRRVRVLEKEGSIVESDTRSVWCDRSACEERAADGVTVTRRFFTQSEQIGSTTQFLLRDHLGSVTAVTGSAAALLARYSYDPWGRPSLVSGASTTSIGYTGHRWHERSGLWLTWYRAYDPALARWLSEDPAGFLEGTNQYAYVHNRPLVELDPTGLAAVVAPGPNILEVVEAAKTFWRNYQEMQKANAIGADKYFHCMANCQATLLGPAGKMTAKVISEVRELTDQYIKGDTRAACDEDRAANRQGQQGNTSSPCELLCSQYLVNGLPPNPNIIYTP